MSETNYKSIVGSMNEKEWDRLTPGEKALCVSYKRLLMTDRKVSRSIMHNINKIHLKYPEFHMGCVPSGLGNGKK